MLNAMLEVWGIQKDWLTGAISWQPLGGQRTYNKVWIPGMMLFLFEALGWYWTVRAYMWLWDVLRSGVIPF